MKVTSYADINDLLGIILSRIQTILGDKLIGLYIFGSLATGDFDYESSDIDLVAAISADLNEEEFENLKMMHIDIMLDNKKWNDRIEICYISAENLKKPELHCKIALISPGEPFHFKGADNDWIINRYVIREKGITLFGPSPKTLIDPISKEVLKHAIQELMKEWSDWIKQIEIVSPINYQVYMIMTMCRALYTFKTGDFVSKKQAMLWAKKELPEWSLIIDNASVWRNEQANHNIILGETLRFVRFIIDQIVR
jgi:predicted nucleotidyltransferase